MNELKEYLPLVLPLLAIQIILGVTSLVHVLKHPNYKFGNKIIWSLVVMFINIIGPTIYFMFGRAEE